MLTKEDTLIECDTLIKIKSLWGLLFGALRALGAFKSRGFLKLF